MSFGSTLTSTESLSLSGTIIMIGSPAAITPPTVFAVDWNDNAVLRCADVDPLELIFRRNFALDSFADLAVGLAQLLGDVAGEILVNLENLQLDFGDPALGFRRRSD